MVANKAFEVRIVRDDVWFYSTESPTPHLAAARNVPGAWILPVQKLAFQLRFLFPSNLDVPQGEKPELQIIVAAWDGHMGFTMRQYACRNHDDPTTGAGDSTGGFLYAQYKQNDLWITIDAAPTVELGTPLTGLKDGQVRLLWMHPDSVHGAAVVCTANNG